MKKLALILLLALSGCSHTPPEEYCQDKADKYLGGYDQCVAEKQASNERRHKMWRAFGAGLQGAGQGLSSASQNHVNCTSYASGGYIYTNCN